VHIHALFSFATLPAAYWAHRRGVPYVIRPLGTLNEWGMRNRRPWLKKLSFTVLERRIIHNASMIHYTSAQERHEAELLDIEAPSTVIPNALPDRAWVGASRDFRERHPELRDRRVILFLSRVDRKKGLDLLLHAFATVRREVSNIALVVVGNGDDAFVAELKADAETRGIAEDVLWTGFLAGEDKASALAAAEIYALPSYSENFSIAVAEAMAAGIPVVISDQVGIHTDIAAASAGLVTRCDANDVAAALIRLLADPDLCTAMGQNGQRLVSARYSQAAVTSEVLDVYNRIAS
jgi:glycosyltransferase involved in cell wall biosynthesis